MNPAAKYLWDNDSKINRRMSKAIINLGAASDTRRDLFSQWYRFDWKLSTYLLDILRTEADKEA